MIVTLHFSKQCILEIQLPWHGMCKHICCSSGTSTLGKMENSSCLILVNSHSCPTKQSFAIILFQYSSGTTQQQPFPGSLCTEQPLLPAHRVTIFGEQILLGLCAQALDQASLTSDRHLNGSKIKQLQAILPSLSRLPSWASREKWKGVSRGPRPVQN